MSSATAVLSEISNAHGRYSYQTLSSWDEAHRVLEAKRGGSDSFKLENNTYLQRRERPGDRDAYAVKYHKTDIVTYEPDGSVILRNGGWFTMTTKQRIEAYAPVHILSDMGRWFVVKPSAPARWPGYGSDLRPHHYEAFYDGFRVGPRGGIKAQPQESDAEERRELREAARAYINDFIDALEAGDVPPPSGGDCWYCALETNEGESMGDAADNASHLRSHIDEDYYVPSLMMRALKERGSPAAGYYAHAKMHDNDNTGLLGPDTFRFHAFSALARYLCPRIGVVPMRPSR